jgi:hypothetical protein
MSKPHQLLFIVCVALLPLSAGRLSAAPVRWKAPELIGAAITDVSGDKITFKAKEGATRVPKQNIQNVRDVAQNSIGVAGLRPGLVVSDVSLNADGTIIRSMTVAPQPDEVKATKSRSNIQNNRTGTDGATGSDSAAGVNNAAAEKHAISTKGTGTSGRSSADHAISTKGTGASGRSTGKASPTPTPTP